jgi:2-deoxy-D-gluconate 3-dehydrogenase
MDIRLDNKVAIVTGAASGIGLACVKRLIESGAKIALVDINTTNLENATQQIQGKGISGGYQLDVTNLDAIASVVDQIRDDLGEIDLLVSSAGGGIEEPIVNVTAEKWDIWNSINTKGLFFFSQAVAVQSMIPRKSGAIVHIASIYGLVAGRRHAAYCASKGAVVQLTRAQAIEWAPISIRVNAVAPTYVLTNATEEYLKDPKYKTEVLNSIPLRRLATVDDVAAAVCFLLSGEASMITGIVLPVDGGWTAQ